MNVIRPQQRLKNSEKDKEWKESNVVYWAGRTNLYPVVNSDAIALYAAAAGKLDESVYTYVTNPLNTARPELKGYPAKMRNIDILSPNIQTLIGELSQRFFNPIVVALNSDLQSKKEKKEYELRIDQLKRDFVNGLVQMGLVPEQISQTPLPDSIINKTVSNLKDQLAIMGQQAITFILQDKNINRIRSKTFYDFIVLSRFFTYKDVRDNDIVYDWISPLEMSFTNTPNIDDVEDSEAVKRGVTLPMTQIMDMFSDVEGFQEIIPELEQRLSTIGYNTIYPGIITDVLRGDLNQPFTAENEGLFVEHVNWTSMKMLKRVKGTDMFGNNYKEDYDEDYVTLPNEEVEEFWVNEKWEGYRLDGKYILGVQAIPFQRGTYDNPNKCKNLYNGRIFMNNYIIPQSILEKGIVYQIKYNIVHYNLEMTINKNLDKITIFPVGILPKKEGQDEFTAMYYAKAMGIIFVDDTNPSTIQALQYMRSIDMSLNTYIKDMYGLLQQIKSDWDESVGISRQRKGETMASDGKAVTEEAIFRSSIISEEFFRQHEETIVKDLQGLMDLSKVAWANGKKGAYVDSDYKNVEFELDPTVYCFSDHQIFIENSAKVAKELDMMKAQLGNIAQQTNNLGILPRIAQATNLSKLTEQIDEIEAKFHQQQQAQVDAENQLKSAQLESEEKDRQLEIYKIDENNDTKYEVALLQSEATVLGFGKGEEGVTDVTLLDEMAFKREELLNKLNVEREKIAESRNKRIEEAKIDRENMKNDEKIANINAKHRKKANKQK